ncbi:MAG: LptF/LptG family permease [Planctomycetota bacterium]
MILQRYILRELLITFIAALVSLTAVIFVGMALVQLQALQYFPASAIKEIAPYFLPLTLSFALPVGVLIACALVFGRLAADNEIDAIRVAGVPLRRVLAPPLLVGILASAATLYMNEEWIPRSHLKRRQITQRGIQQALYGLSRDAYSVPIGNEVVLAWRSRRGEVFADFQVKRLDPKTGRVRTESRAAEGRLYRDPNGRDLWIDLVDGTLVEYPDPTRRDTINPGTFHEYREVIDISALMGGYNPRERDMTSQELERGIAAGGAKGYTVDRLKAELFWRRALGLAPLIFALFGTPLGILVRRGSRIAGMGWSVLPVFVVYYPLMTAAQALAARQKLDPSVALWAPDVVMLLGALVLLRIVLRK